MYCFFRELGKPFHANEPSEPPSPQNIQRLLKLAPNTTAGWLPLRKMQRSV